MIVVQTILLLIGATAVGTTLGGLLFIYLWDILDFGRGAPHGGAYVLVGGMLFCGAPMGAVLGLVVGIWVNRRLRGAPWSRATWVGLAIGFVLGVAIYAQGGLGWERLDVIEAVVDVAACATLGGMLGAATRPIWTRG